MFIPGLAYPLQSWLAAKGRADETRRKLTFMLQLQVLGVLLSRPAARQISSLEPKGDIDPVDWRIAAEFGYTR